MPFVVPIRPVGYLLVLMLGAVPSGLPAGEPEEKAKHLSIRSTRLYSSPYPSERDLGSDFRYYGARLAIVEEGDGGELVAKDIDILHEFIFRARKTPVRIGVGNYLEFREGDLVPVLRHVYRVTKLTKGHGGHREYGHEAVLEWVPDDKLPAGLALGEDPVVVPLKNKASIDDYVLLTQRVDRPAGKAGTASGVLDITYYPDRRKYPDRQKDPVQNLRATVRGGDVLVLGDNGYKVRNVVPQDAKTKAIGWVELAPDPIPKADLVRDKIKFVEPEPVGDKDGPKPGK